ncbi:phage holin family protein [Bacillaceae bacterium SIJ1]|uniref:phage holin family protein n=1 Tax=Litoribacterium kuwaitense TaxID=1398745 RepID=UPI0013EA179F|nr:phage holin family protein [Litoribacterium kuwaitense]NGP45343.1 phage holin family protein [Litoribacterium kuwaitense]
MGWIIQWLINALLLMALSSYFDGILISSVGAAFLASFILAVLNVIIKPILIILTLPVTIITLGLFLFVINAITLYLTAQLMGDSFLLDGFFTAVIASVLISVANLVIQNFILDRLRERR